MERNELNKVWKCSVPFAKGQVFLWVGGVNPSTFRVAEVVFDSLFAMRDIGILQSYATMRPNFRKGNYNKIKEKWFRDHRVMVDSGAFSVATNTHSKIDIYEYIDFMEAFKDVTETFITLDVIEDPKASVKNYEMILSKGLPVMPVYHIGEDIGILDEYIKTASIVGIGGSVSENLSGLNQRTCYNKIFCKGDDWRYPPFTLHGLGVSGHRLCFDYPWKSVDNSRAQKFGGYGSLFNPKFLGLYVSDWAMYDVMQDEVIPHPFVPYTDSELRTDSVKRFVYNVAVQRDAHILQRDFDMDRLKADFLSPV